MEIGDKNAGGEEVVVVTNKWLTSILADRATLEDQNLRLADRLEALRLRLEACEHTNEVLVRYLREHKVRRRRSSQQAALAHPHQRVHRFELQAPPPLH